MAKQPTEQQLAGASLKRHNAKRLSGSGGYSLNTPNQATKDKGSAISLLVTMALSFLLAWLLGQGALEPGHKIKSGIEGVDTFLLASKTPTLSGDPLLDDIMVTVMRGLALWVMAALIPILSFVWIKFRDKTGMNIYRVMWGATLATGSIVCAMATYGLPMLKQLIKDFTTG